MLDVLVPMLNRRASRAFGPWGLGHSATHVITLLTLQVPDTPNQPHTAHATPRRRRRRLRSTPLA